MQPAVALNNVARNNAEWCDIVCRSHGLSTRFAGDAWASTARTPQFYPDAVTLAPDAVAGDLLSRIDATAGCSVKDSFAALDLSVHGFRMLFDAEWIVRAGDAPVRAAAPDGPRWQPVRDPSDFARWKRAWSDGEPTDVLRDELLDHEAVTVVAARDDERVIAGAILNRSAHVVGISNFFATGDVSSGPWLGLLGFAATTFPGAPLVGYESGAQLAVALESGFATAGPLRVWIRDA